MRVLALLFAVVLTLAAQTMRLSVGQLKSFLRSSIQLKHDDKQVANYLKRVQLTETFSERDYTEIVAEGLGPKAAEQLRELQKVATDLPKPVVDPAKPPAPTLAEPSDAQKRKMIDEAREISLGYTKSLPDFICLQVTRRYFDPSGLEYYQLADTVATRLSYFEQKEDYKVVSVNGVLSTAKYDQLGGATSSGEFGTLLKEIFEPGSEATFHWERWAKLRGRIAHVYTYEVQQSRSKWHISWQRQLDIVPAYRGYIYIARDVPVVLRVTLEAIGVPPSFPIQEARTMLDYDYTDISGRDFLLPMRAEMKMREGKLLIRNLTEFRNYRKFGADTSITFETPEPLPDEKTTEKPPND